MSSLPKADVVIVGGGPGGTATAIHCAQKGLKVTLLEQAEFPRSHPGETLHPGIEPLLKKLGVAEQVLSAGFLRHPGHYIEWQGEREFQAFGEDEQGPWLGFQAVRSQFDSLLLEQAQTLGVQILQPCRALEPLVNQGHVQGLNTTLGSIDAAFVVDAAGSCQWLARKLGIRTTPYSPPLKAYYGYATGECPDRDQAPLIASDAEGWTWIAKVEHQRYQWTRLSFDSQPGAHWQPEDLADLFPEGKARAVDVTWRLVNPAAGPGYFLVGDAAAVLDPASSHGVLKAMTSGMMAAHLIVQSFQQGEQLQPSSASRYCAWLRTNFYHDLIHLQGFYAPILSALSSSPTLQSTSF